MSKINLLLLLFCFSALNAQQSEFLNYSWDTYADTTYNDTINDKNGQLVTLERRISDVYVNSENNFEQIEIFHQRIKVLNSDALDYWNKIYFSMDDVIDILEVKARSVSPGGKITELPGENIVQMSNLENRGDYKSFVIEGAEIGGEIEFYYKLRKKFNPFSTIYLQSSVPKTNIHVIINYPAELVYKVKSYNNLPEFDIEEGEKYTTQSLSIPYIPGISEEEYAFYNSNLQRYEVSIFYNTYNSSMRVYSWSKAANNIYSNMFSLSKKEQSALKNILKSCDNKSLKLEKRVRGIEDYVKSAIHSTEGMSYIPIDKSIKLKQNSQFGLTKTFTNLFDLADIKYELVLTSKKDNQPFDPDFNGWNFLDQYLIYFPEIDKVLVPDDPTYRLDLFPYNYHGSFGLFLKKLNYNESIRTFSYDIKKLPTPVYSQNSDTIIAEIQIDDDFSKLNAHVYRSFSGLDGQTFQYYWSLSDESTRNDMITQLCNMGSEEVEIEKYTANNYLPEDIGIKPFSIDVEHSVHGLLEYAGSDIILKIGETIGAQAELYQTNERKLPVEIDILRNYYRKITFLIPEGFQVYNADNLNTYFEVKVDDKISCMFQSEYQIAGDKLIVTSTEYYSDHYYPKERFEEFRSVINAAADFNKITIILRQKNN